MASVAPGCGSWFSSDRGDCRSAGAACRCPALDMARAPRRGAERIDVLGYAAPFIWELEPRMAEQIGELGVKARIALCDPDRTHNPSVVGSSPTRPTIRETGLRSARDHCHDCSSCRKEALLG